MTPSTGNLGDQLLSSVYMWTLTCSIHSFLWSLGHSFSALLTKYSCNPAHLVGFLIASSFSSLGVVLYLVALLTCTCSIWGWFNKWLCFWCDLDSPCLKTGSQQWTAWSRGSTFGNDGIRSSWAASLASAPSYCCSLPSIDGCSPVDSAKLITTIPPPSQGKASGGRDGLPSACSPCLGPSAWCLELMMIDCNTGLGSKLQCFSFPAIHLPLVKFGGGFLF